MQDNIIASHTCFGGHMDVNCFKLVYKLSNVPDDLKWATNTHDTIYTHFQGITNNIYGFGSPFLLLNFLARPQPVHHISTRPYSFLPVQMTGGLFI